MININSWIPYSEALGPGLRAVVWLQGCSRDCVGCISPEMRPNIPVSQVDPIDLARLIIEIPGIDGITVSGGEPFDQPEPLRLFLESIKCLSSLNTMVYSGYKIEELTEDMVKSRCLAYTDLLVDGPFQIELETRLWRGSLNQRFCSPSGHFSNRVLRYWASKVQDKVEFRIHKDRIFTIGIPERTFLDKFRSKLREEGIFMEEGSNE